MQVVMTDTGNDDFARDATQQPTSDHFDPLSSKCQVQLVLNKNVVGVGWDYVQRMLEHFERYPKFLFSGTQRWRLGYDPKEEFERFDWDYDRIDMEAPEYTPSTNTINFNFILSGYPFPEKIIEILRSNGWTVTGRYRMGLQSPTTHKIDWDPWDYQLHEAPKRAALLVELEQLDKDIAKLDREISECQALLAIMPIVQLPSSREDKNLLLSRTLANFRFRLTDLVVKHTTLFNLAGGGEHIRDMIDILRNMQVNNDASQVIEQDVLTMTFMIFLFCCQCVFEIQIAKYVFKEHIDEDIDDWVMPSEPFLGQFRELFNSDEDFKSEWKYIIINIWKSIQYMETNPKESDFLHLYPWYDYIISANNLISTHQSQKPKLQARRLEVLRDLAHLHPDTIHRGSPSPILIPEHSTPDGAGPSNKRKLTEMATLLDRFFI